MCMCVCVVCLWVAVDVVSFSRMTEEFLLTAGTDQEIHLWALSGSLVGTFGQNGQSVSQ